MSMPQELNLIRIVVGAAATLGTVVLIALVWPAFRRDILALIELRKHFRRRGVAIEREDEA
jgi:PST family polysaccharide transporter